MRWRVAGLLPIVLAALALSPAVRADSLPNQHLAFANQVIRWAGAYNDPTGQGYNAATDSTCTAGSAQAKVCDIFTIQVDLDLPYALKGPQNPAPPGLTKLQPYPIMPGDGLLVSVKWPTDFDQWNLYVDGTAGNPANPLCQGAAACGLDLDSNSQSVLVQPPAGAVTGNATHWHSTYTVKVVAFYTDFDPTGVDRKYAGEAQLFLDPSQRQGGNRPMLPKIQTVPPSNFHVSDIPPVPSNPTGWRYTPQGTFAGALNNSCYLDETLQFGSTKCLRFDNATRNIGEGPLSLEFNYDAAALQTALAQTPIPTELTGGCQMKQEVVSTNLTTTLRDAGPCVFHTQHMHFHYQNFGRYQLFAVGSDGNPHAIPVPHGKASTAPVSIARKVGFCTIDVDNYTFGMSAGVQRPRTFSFPTCNVPNGYAAPGSQVAGPSPQYVGTPEFMGISPGWGDIYTWDLPAQYIDITHVPDGVYEVASSTNFDGLLLTSGGEQETGVTCIQLKTDSGGATTVKTVKTFPSQPNDQPLPSCQVAGASTVGRQDSGNPTAGPSHLPNTSAAAHPAVPGRQTGTALLIAVVAALAAAVTTRAALAHR